MAGGGGRHRPRRLKRPEHKPRPQRRALLERLLCALGMHQRSSSRRRWTGTRWISRCRFCAAPMARSARGRWRVLDDDG